ncbi:MAG TPA: XdhC/CoxI family protein [Anaerolineaceae bacterium]
MTLSYSRLAEIEQTHQAAAVCTVIQTRGSTPRHSGSKMVVFPDGKIEGSIGGGEVESRVISLAIESIHDTKPRYTSFSMIDPNSGDPGICGGTVEIYIEPLLPPPTLLIIGGGHVGKATAHLGKWLGFRVYISDDRPEICNPGQIPEADEFFIANSDEVASIVPLNTQTYVIMTTRGSDYDQKALPGILKTDAAYIGVIGSRRRWKVTYDTLVKMGIPQNQLDRIHSPLGLDLHAETPEEIAVSILAEIILLRKGGTGASMKFQVPADGG